MRIEKGGMGVGERELTHAWKLSAPQMPEKRVRRQDSWRSTWDAGGEGSVTREAFWEVAGVDMAEGFEDVRLSSAIGIQ